MQLEDAGVDSWDEGDVVGKCVRYPPKFFYAELLNGEFPVVNSEEYCGEHSRNPHL